MGLLDMNETRLQAIYHREWLRQNRGYVDPRKCVELDRAIIQYAKENNCSYDQAYIVAKTGKKLF